MLFRDHGFQAKLHGDNIGSPNAHAADQANGGHSDPARDRAYPTALRQALIASTLNARCILSM